MKFTRHRFRLVVGLLTCAVGVFFLFAPGLLIHRIVDGTAWILIGGFLSFVPEFRPRFTREWFTLGLGLLIGLGGLVFTLAALKEVLGPRAHGLLRFYEFIGIGPLMLTTGVVVGFCPKHAR